MAEDEMYITRAEHEAPFSHQIGITLPKADKIEPVQPGRQRVGNSSFVAPADHIHTIEFPVIVNEIIPEVSDEILLENGFDLEVIKDGLLVVATGFGDVPVLWYRLNATWYYVAFSEFEE